MTMQSFRRDFLKGCTALAGPSLMARQSAASRTRPNVVYIHSHDTGRYLEPYGHAVPAPNLMRLAREGVLFRRAFCAAPTCSPSRAALLTGLCPHSNGMLGLSHTGFSLYDYSRHLAPTLRKAGYASALGGVHHIGGDPAAVYDRLLRPKSNLAQDVWPGAVEFLNSRPKQPFFLDVGFQETHRMRGPFHPPGPREDERYCLPPATIPDTPQTRRDMAGFKASARIMDAAAGEILQALERAGLAGNTLVISTTDHGIPFPGMKCNLTDHGLGVSLIVRGPGGFSGGKVCDSMVSHVDLFPTICELLEIEAPGWLQGKSMMPLIRGAAKEINDQIFGEVTYHASYEPQRAVRTQRWKYIRRFGDRSRPVLPNCDDGLSKELWLENGWRERRVDSEQLYDLVFDPNEMRNLAGNHSSESTLNEMRTRLERWMQATNDPLLKGPVKPPPGATNIVDPDRTSTHEKGARP
jgi:N-sulfoglucosamine sulfohydrolase